MGGAVVSVLVLVELDGGEPAEGRRRGPTGPVAPRDGGKPHGRARPRGAGLLLEDAVMEAPVALFPVAPASVAAVSATPPSGGTPPGPPVPASLQVHVHKP